MDNNEYTLTDPERAALQAIHSQVVAAQLAVYNAKNEEKTAIDRWEGAKQMLANANGMESAQLAPDFSKLTRNK